MTPQIRAIAAGLIFIVLYWFAWWLIQPDPEMAPVMIDSPQYHGADAITVKWNGETTAWKWEGRKYRAMWVRKG